MRQIKVLIVEDNKDHGFLSQSAFMAHGALFSVAVARNGSKALNQLTNDYDVAFVDLDLPDMSGLDLMKKLHSACPGLPVIITTGKGSEEIAVSTFREGAVDYIIKNHNYFTLLPTVAIKVFESRRRPSRRRRPRIDADKVYEQILAASADLLEINASSLMVYNQRLGHLETRASRGLSHNYIDAVRPKIGESLEGQAVAESKPLYSADISAEPAYCFKDMAANEGIRSALSVPFSIDEATRGVLNLYSPAKNRFDRKDQQMVSHLVELSRMALENLKLYYREHHIAETLQKSHFPKIDSRVRDWEIAHRYKVSMEEALLGGDFYDMFPVAGDRRAVVIADVSGKGINAAAQTAMVKYTLRSYALDDPDPAAVLERTHRAFCSYSQTEHFVTVFYGIVDPILNTFSFCSAGHPPALLFSAKNNAMSSLGEAHLPVGAWNEDVSFSTGSVDFEHGDTMLLYTDGLTDCRRTGLKKGQLFGETRLERLFHELAPGTAEEIADGIVDRVMEYSAGKMRDDMAFCVVKLRPRDDLH